MPAPSTAILKHLKTVDAERTRRSALPALLEKVVALKRFQQRRFAHTYTDLLLSERYGPASRFFLDELYGPDDFSRRDAQFARVVPALSRVFSDDVVATVATLAALHALSETLDTAMAEALGSASIDATDYVRAWQRVGRAADRARQIELTLDLAKSLDRFTTKPLLRSSLRLMRGPARVAGLSELQQVLEAGFDTFRAMGGADTFVDLVGARERAFASALFGASGDAKDAGAAASTRLARAKLPPSGEVPRASTRAAGE